MATLVKTPSRTWKAVILKAGWPTTSKSFRIKRNADDWARHTEDEMRGIYVQSRIALALTSNDSHASRTLKPPSGTVLADWVLNKGEKYILLFM